MYMNMEDMKFCICMYISYVHPFSSCLLPCIHHFSFPLFLSVPMCLLNWHTLWINLLCFVPCRNFRSMAVLTSSWLWSVTRLIFMKIEVYLLKYDGLFCCDSCLFSFLLIMIWKADLHNIVILFFTVPQDALEYAEKNGMFFIETSAKTADNINQLFEVHINKDSTTIVFTFYVSKCNYACLWRMLTLH